MRAVGSIETSSCRVLANRAGSIFCFSRESRGSLPTKDSPMVRHCFFGSSASGGIGKNSTVHRHGKEYTKDYLPDVLINHTLAWMDDLPEPWLMVVAWPTPHGPFTAAPWAQNTMSGYKAPRTENYNPSDSFQQQKHWLLRQLRSLSKETSAEVDKYYQMRLEALKSVDQHVEKLISKLESRGQIDNTVVMYTSDNGFQFGQHRLAMDKRHLYENDIRVPFVIRGPNIPKNSTSSEIIANIDIAPTILDISGQKD